MDNADVRRTLKILIIDDSPEDRRAFSRMIEQCPKHEHEISEAENAYDGLVVAQIDDWDCIFLDYNLPDISGLDFLTEYRKHTPKIVLPVVMLTGQGRESVAVEAMKKGAFDYVSKAEATPERLNGIIHHALSVATLHRKEEQERRDRMRDEEELKLRQLKAAELYAISVASSTFSQAVADHLQRIDDVLSELLSGAPGESRQAIRSAQEASEGIRTELQELSKLDLFGLLRRSEENSPVTLTEAAVDTQ